MRHGLGASSSAVLSLTLPPLFEGKPWYYLLVSQLLLALPFVAFLVPLLGPLPHRPRATHLRYPRLGTLPRHYTRKGNGYEYAARLATSEERADVEGGVVEERRDVVFFNVALKGFHPMSVPVCEPPQTLIGEAIHSMERDDPPLCVGAIPLRRLPGPWGEMSYLKDALHAHIDYSKERDVDMDG